MQKEAGLRARANWDTQRGAGNKVSGPALLLYTVMSSPCIALRITTGEALVLLSRVV